MSLNGYDLIDLKILISLKARSQFLPLVSLRMSNTSGSIVDKVVLSQIR